MDVYVLLWRKNELSWIDELAFDTEAEGITFGRIQQCQMEYEDAIFQVYKVTK